MAAPTPNLVLSILFTIKFIAGSPSEDLGECFCDNGCYKAKDTPFRLQCCDDICENAAERRTENLCNEHCKCYQTIKNNKVCMTFLKKERAGTSLNRAILFAFLYYGIGRPARLRDKCTPYSKVFSLCPIAHTVKSRNAGPKSNGNPPITNAKYWSLQDISFNFLYWQ